MAELVFGHMASRTLSTAVELGVADVLGDRTRTAEEVTAEVDTQPQATLRLLRAMASLRLVTEEAPGRFSLAPSGTYLRTDSPTSMAAMVEMFGDPAMLRAWERLGDSVTTGEIAFDQVFGKDFFAHLKEHPRLSAVFNAAMSQGTQGAAQVLGSVYDFGRHHTLMDIGGGDGTLLAGVLDAHPNLRGIVFDTKEGLAQAPELLASKGLTDRCELATGDFFTSIPEGADAHLVKSVLHDWSDEQCVTILEHSRAALPADGRLLVLEPVLPPTVDPNTGGVTYLSDLNMLVNVGGRERTREDFEDVCGRAGFTVSTVTPVAPPSPFSLIEALPR